MKQILIGSDPEFFIENKKKEFINAYHLNMVHPVCGDKLNPITTPFGAVQIDGMCVEINTKPTSSEIIFGNLIERGKDYIKDKFNCNISKESVKKFNEGFLETQHPGSIELGCDADFDGWNNAEINDMPDMFLPIRTAGGHIHIGWTNDTRPYSNLHLDMCCDVARQMDYVLGLWSLSLDKNGTQRRELYGKAAAFRPKHYGVEYRTLSNFWIFNKSYCKQVLKRAKAGLLALMDGIDFSKQYGNYAQTILNNKNIKYDNRYFQMKQEIDNTLRKYKD